MLFVRAGLAGGDTVLVQGAGGGVATALIALADMPAVSGSGPRAATSSSGERALELGADEVFEPGARLPERVDAVMETVGEATWSHSLKALQAGRPTRRLRRDFRGQPAGRAQPGVLPAAVRRGFDHGHAGRAGLPWRTSWCTTGLRPLIDSTYDLRDARSAFERLASGDVFGKIVVTVGE